MLRLPGLTGFPLHSGSVRLVGCRRSVDNFSADGLVHPRGAIRVQNNFHPLLGTKLCEHSGNMVQDLVLRNFKLRGNLIVR